ncbi:hypothetical protein [Nocardiopsis sp. NRRL B-16309]|uniref:hypothetical protein n=1 Tax=Nocardiopsis sp. NRRL B-16309 TaxID=1519494 RepID=UPI0006B0622E|nr:hypothetical protein [Nocardiopsis sp. NRRL B-16309]KOX10122.1 hypothetical protein ADL05_25920 [Nocardiopsis sp. NRRL B-16309]
MDLRDRIADAIARAHDDTPASVHPLMEDYRETADKVMEVVDAEIGRLTRERDEARDAARTYLHNGARLINKRAVKQYHLEEEIKQLRRTVPDPDDLATVLELTNTHAHKVSRLWGPNGTSCEKCVARFRVNAAPARARQLKEEK